LKKSSTKAPKALMCRYITLFCTRCIASVEIHLADAEHTASAVQCQSDHIAHQHALEAPPSICPVRTRHLCHVSRAWLASGSTMLHHAWRISPDLVTCYLLISLRAAALHRRLATPRCVGAHTRRAGSTDISPCVIAGLIGNLFPCLSHGVSH
jgi:hypothetical protein